MNYLGLGYIGIGLGMAGCLIGAGLGIGKLASSALDGTARQPEAAGTLQTMMIIPAAMIEGLGLLALVVAFLGVLTLNKGVDTAAAAQKAAVAAEAPAQR